MAARQRRQRTLTRAPALHAAVEASSSGWQTAQRRPRSPLRPGNPGDRPPVTGTMGTMTQTPPEVDPELLRLLSAHVEAVVAAAGFEFSTSSRGESGGELRLTFGGAQPEPDPAPPPTWARPRPPTR